MRKTEDCKFCGEYEGHPNCDSSCMDEVTEKVCCDNKQIETVKVQEFEQITDGIVMFFQVYESRCKNCMHVYEAFKC